jgi:hypothetical protein
LCSSDSTAHMYPDIAFWAFMSKIIIIDNNNNNNRFISVCVCVYVYYIILLYHMIIVLCK